MHIIEMFSTEMSDDGLVTGVIRPAAVLPEGSARAVLRELERSGVRVRAESGVRGAQRDALAGADLVLAVGKVGLRAWRSETVEHALALRLKWRRIVFAGAARRNGSVDVAAIDDLVNAIARASIPAVAARFGRRPAHRHRERQQGFVGGRRRW